MKAAPFVLLVPFVALVLCVLSPSNALSAPSAPAQAPANDAWWVWLPSRAEARAIAATLAPGDRIYWHTATLTWSGSAWRDSESPAAPPPSLKASASGTDAPRGPEIIPVLRLQSAGAVETDAAWPPVLERLREMRSRSGADWLQLDCDCPDRLLPRYALRMRELRRALAPARLSVTALAAWAPKLDPALWKSAADELTPMFYDLEPDRPDEILARRARPLVEPETCARWLPAWQALEIPWRCGLANFRRLSRFRTDGSALGHFPSWNPSPFFQAGSLGPMESAGPGAWRWRVLENIRLSGQRGAATGDWLVFREPDPASLTQLAAAARAAGAEGMVWFSRPSGRMTDGWSAAHLRTLNGNSGHTQPQPAKPAATLRREGSTFLLSAGPKADFPPVSGSGGGGPAFGWLLEIRGNGVAAWETSSAGQFISLAALPPVPGPQSRGAGLTWGFPGLTAGASLRSAPVHLPPGGATLSWRVRPLSPRNAAKDPKDAEAAREEMDSRFPWRDLK